MKCEINLLCTGHRGIGRLATHTGGTEGTQIVQMASKRLADPTVALIYQFSSAVLLPRLVALFLADWSAKTQAWRKAISSVSQCLTDGDKDTVLVICLYWDLA